MCILTMVTDAQTQKVWKIPFGNALEYLNKMGFAETRCFNRRGGIQIAFYHRVSGGVLSPTVYKIERKVV